MPMFRAAAADGFMDMPLSLPVHEGCITQAAGPSPIMRMATPSLGHQPGTLHKGCSAPPPAPALQGSIQPRRRRKRGGLPSWKRQPTPLGPHRVEQLQVGACMHACIPRQAQLHPAIGPLPLWACNACYLSQAPRMTLNDHIISVLSLLCVSPDHRD
jgi:hypothetical protein